ncbi:prosaposin isoform X1 [Megalopta genalis]|uniref:prosaposin isoform X1 n=1 Tax=Megalopta genalis TaxID=115081 RepID=UPI003FD4724E
MKTLITLCAFLVVCTANVIINAGQPTHLLGKDGATWGPSHWCANIKNAAEYSAVGYCIKTLWNKMEVPEDNDDVCNVCKNMVQMARDQLESNQTQEDLKAVFEGSCKLIHIKPIVKECIIIVDDYIPELVETLASQMNPSVVCSVAGLCNSAHFDKLLEEYSLPTSKVADIRSHSLEKDEVEPDNCTKCLTVAAHMEYKLNNSPRKQVLQKFLNFCAELSSFSDACSATILTYFDTIYAHLQENFNAQNICHLSGQCTAQFHKHEDSDGGPKVEIRPLSSVGMVDLSDDLPCKLCEQLVEHLRDLLVANTTESEFHQVLDGLCQQTKSFAKECTSIVDEYYPEIYEYLTKRINSNSVCEISGICPAPGKAVQSQPIWPLLPQNVEQIGLRIFQNSNKNVKSKKEEKSKPLSESEIEGMQLDISRMFPFPLSEGPVKVNGKSYCVICEYILHYIQETLSNRTTEETVKRIVKEVCNKLPKGVKDECSQFIDSYGDAVIAILIQGIDPAHVCEMLRLCPSKSFMKLWESVPAKYTLEEKRVSNKPSCPLCLLAITKVYNEIKNNKTEAKIKEELDKLCNALPTSVTKECTDLVKVYTKDLVEVILADFTPEEACAYLHLCDSDKNSYNKNIFVMDKNGEILTNEIPDTVPSDNEWSGNEKKIVM